MERKYLSEFGLHTYSSNVAICYPNDLKNLSIDSKNHIYMITLIPKLTFNPDSLEVFEDHISLKVNVKTEEGITSRKIETSLFTSNHKEYEYSFDKPLKTLFVKNKYGAGIGIRVLAFYLDTSSHYMDAEIVYIGQSFGKEGERDASDRLKSHSTLQEIQSDILFEEPDNDIALVLFEFTPIMLASFDGRTKQFEKSLEEDTAHFLNAIAQPPLVLTKSIVTITEAALIHYFKPKYNDKFKNNFPDPEHAYKEFYELDYNSILVELGLDAIKTNLFSKEKEYNPFESIRYTLHPENIRKSMFDMFGKVEE
ncbi:hypothetical protein [Bacillus toyonensis]|uniref:hypothetical protein n=1 Tax=Bacillus toyonensis TaxID=155322 RepID=UPI002E2467B0|nr:hypothetical protein [Bacillus toyonensis]